MLLPFPVLVDKKWFQRIRDFISHVGITQIETSEDDGLEFVLSLHILVDEITDEHVDKNHVGRVDESDVLRKEMRQKVHGGLEP